MGRVPEIVVKIDLIGLPAAEKARVHRVLWRELGRIGQVGDGGGGHDTIDAWVAVMDEHVALPQLQAIVTGQGLSERARIYLRPKLAQITFAHDFTPEREAVAIARIHDLAALIQERELGDNMAVGQLPGSVVLSLSLFNADVGVLVIEALIDELGLCNDVVFDVV